jgi:hypothetical protein
MTFLLILVFHFCHQDTQTFVCTYLGLFICVSAFYKLKYNSYIKSAFCNYRVRNIFIIPKETLNTIKQSLPLLPTPADTYLLSDSMVLTVLYISSKRTRIIIHGHSKLPSFM